MKLFIKERFQPTKRLIEGAVVNGTPEMLTLLLNNFPEQQLQDLGHMLVLHRGVLYNKLENVRLLLDAGLDMNYISSESPPESLGRENLRETALHLAAWDAQIKMAKLLLERGARIDIPDSKGSTALEKATTSKQFEVEKLMLKMQSGNERGGDGEKWRSKISRFWKK
jgi:ankyrin repeat protein